MRTLLLGLLLAAGAPALAIQASPPRTITKSEIRTDSPARTHRRLRDIIWRMFEQEDMRREERPQRALDSLPLRTHVRDTGVPGLCRYDLAWIEFSPAELPVRGAATRVQPIGIQADSYFRFLTQPGDDIRLADEELLDTEGPCARLRNRNLSFFRAEDANIANRGYRAFLRLQRDVRSGPSTNLECDLGWLETRTCRDLILSLNQDQIQQIRGCHSEESGQECLRISLEEHEVELIVACCVTPGPPHGQIARARISEPIILSHPVQD